MTTSIEEETTVKNRLMVDNGSMTTIIAEGTAVKGPLTAVDQAMTVRFRRKTTVMDAETSVISAGCRIGLRSASTFLPCMQAVPAVWKTRPGYFPARNVGACGPEFAKPLRTNARITKRQGRQVQKPTSS